MGYIEAIPMTWSIWIHSRTGEMRITVESWKISPWEVDHGITARRPKYLPQVELLARSTSGDDISGKEQGWNHEPVVILSILSH